MKYNIEKLREYLFKQEINSFIQVAMEILEDMGKKINTLTPNELLLYDEQVKKLGLFLSNGDYLAVSDVLKYELAPLFEKRGSDYEHL
jgi:hypothetical protein